MKATILPLLFISHFVWAFDHAHTTWNQLVSKYVVNLSATSAFKYGPLHKNKADRDQLKKYLASLSAVAKKDFDSFSRSQQMAFLINAYNAFTVELILQNYPIKSIKKIGGWFGSPWKKEFFKLFGKKTHLDHIEHGILRKKYKDSRIHFAVNCASIGCPALLDAAFTGDKLENQLNSLRKKFLADKSRNHFSEKKNRLTISKIFSWFKEDFVAEAPNLAAYVKPHMPDGSKIDPNTTSVRFAEYDWNLNEYKKTSASPKQN